MILIRILIRRHLYIETSSRMIVAFQNVVPLLTLLPLGPHYIYMRQWIRSILVQIMACRLCGAKQLSQPMLAYCQSIGPLGTNWNFNQNTKLSIHKNAPKNIICEMVAILSGPGGYELTPFGQHYIFIFHSHFFPFKITFHSQNIFSLSFLFLVKCLRCIW